MSIDVHRSYYIMNASWQNRTAASWCKLQLHRPTLRHRIVTGSSCWASLNFGSCKKKWSEAPQIANKDHGNIDYTFSNLLYRFSIIFSLSKPNFHFRILEAQGFALWLQPLTRPNASTITDPQHFHKSHIVMAAQLHYYLTSTKLSSIRVPNSCPQRESAS